MTLKPIPSAPSSVTATQSSICQGASANLNGTSAGNTINWYTVPTAGTNIGTSLSGVNFSVSPASTGINYYYAETQSWGYTQSFNYTGSIKTWTVPSGISNITIIAIGAQGGGINGGYGASMTGTFNVTPGQVLSIMVGQQGGGIYAGGGGGSFVALGADYSTAIANCCRRRRRCLFRYRR